MFVSHYRLVDISVVPYGGRKRLPIHIGTDYIFSLSFDFVKSETDY